MVDAALLSFLRYRWSFLFFRSSSATAFISAFPSYHNLERTCFRPGPASSRHRLTSGERSSAERGGMAGGENGGEHLVAEPSHRTGREVGRRSGGVGSGGERSSSSYVRIVQTRGLRVRRCNVRGLRNVFGSNAHPLSLARCYRIDRVIDEDEPFRSRRRSRLCTSVHVSWSHLSITATSSRGTRRQQIQAKCPPSLQRLRP